MEEQNAFEILQNYPKANGLIFETHECLKHFYLTPSNPILNTKFVIFKKDELIFFAYDSFAAKAFTNETFTGLYAVSNFENDYECEINKKYWLDIFRTNKKKTGNKNIDNNLTFISKSDKENKWLTEDILSLFLRLHNAIKPIKLIVRYDYLPMINDLKNKSVIGIETNQWVYKSEQVDILLSLGSEIIEKINKNKASIKL